MTSAQGSQSRFAVKVRSDTDRVSGFNGTRAFMPVRISGVGPGTGATPTWEALRIRFPALPCPVSGILNQVSEMALDGGLSQIELAPVQCLILGYRSDPFT